MSLYYFDNNATTRVLQPVLEAMLPWFGEQYGNPSSSHPLGQSAKNALHAARSSIAEFLGASPAEIVFTSGATESCQTAILSSLAALPQRRHIVASTVEHPSTLVLLEHLATQGVSTTLVPVDPDGALDMAALSAAVTDETALVTLMHANNETGVIFPISEAAAIAREKGALFHTDAAQTAGKVPLNVRRLGCDFLSFSGHKLHAPKGVGALFVRKGCTLHPLLHGHQERHRRGGTENLPAIVGLSVACRMAQVRLEQQGTVAALRDELEKSLLRAFPFAWVNGKGPRVPNTTNICIQGYSGEELLHRLGQAGIMASQGSACTAGGTDPSHVLLAMGLDREDALSSLRFSLSHLTTRTEVDVLLDALSAIVRPAQRELVAA